MDTDYCLNFSRHVVDANFKSLSDLNNHSVGCVIPPKETSVSKIRESIFFTLKIRPF